MTSCVGGGGGRWEVGTCGGGGCWEGGTSGVWMTSCVGLRWNEIVIEIVKNEEIN